MYSEYVPILVQVVIALGFGISSMIISLILGQRGRSTPIKNEAYECGMIAQGPSSPRFSVKFYIVAMIFILYDIELVFMYPWALSYNSFFGQHSPVSNPWSTLWIMLVFLVIVGVGHLYVMRKGALNWKK